MENTEALKIYEELVGNVDTLEAVQRNARDDLKNNLEINPEDLSFGFLNIVKSVLYLAPQEINEETGLPNYYITGSLVMNLLPSVDKITLPSGQVIKFDDNIRKVFEVCYRKIHDFDAISTDNSVHVGDIAFKNCKKVLNGYGIQWGLKELGLSDDTINEIFKNCISLIAGGFITDDSMNTWQKTENFYYCKATIKSENGDFDVFITDIKYLLGYKFAAYLLTKSEKDKTDFLKLYKGLSMIYGEEELKQICSEYKKLRPDKKF